MIKWAIIFVSLAGLALGLYTTSTSQQKLPSPPPMQPPSVNPFSRGIAANGLVEPISRTIEIAPSEAGLVIEVFVHVGDTVKQNQPLFLIDPRAIDSELIRATAVRDWTESDLKRLQAMPRPEDVPPLAALLEQAEARQRDAQDEYARLKDAWEKKAANLNEVRRSQYAAEVAAAEVNGARANLDRLRAGAWQQELDVAYANLQRAEADIRAIQIRRDRLTIRSPIDATVIKRNIEPGEFVTPNVGDAALVLGDISRLHVRAQIDEQDAVLLRSGARAMGRVRGPSDALLPLTMLRIEPLAIPKKQITGLASELIDTRIIEAVLSIDDLKGLSIYPGQLVDVYIETRPLP